MKFNPQKHHRRSIRLKEYDYTQPGGYFITMVTFQREYLFGEIQNDEMQLSKFGLVAKEQWEKLPQRFPNIELGAFVIMPNHAHGIIEILDHNGRGTAEKIQNLDEQLIRRAPTAKKIQNLDEQLIRRAPTAEKIQNLDEQLIRRAPTAEKIQNLDEQLIRRAPTTEQFQKPVPGSIPTIIRSYKSAVAYRINLMRTNGVPVWQRNYYEHVIRNHEDWDRIHRYIESNPSMWAEDNENPK